VDTNIELDGNGFTQEEFIDIKRCLETLLSIRQGAQPLARGMGINYEGTIGYPISTARNMLALDIIEKVRIYEPRVEVVSVEFDSNTQGQLIPHVHFVRAEG
jgi:phage baseplate assembly protein W